MRRFVIICMALLGVGGFAPTVGASGLSDALIGALGSYRYNEPVPVIVHFKNPEGMTTLQGLGSRKARTSVIRRLKDAAHMSQRSVLERLSKARSVTRVAPLWIVNAMSMTVEASFLSEMAKWPEVERIELDRVVFAPDVVTSESFEPTWNISRIRAPELWALGITGEGVVMASMDTGVDFLHADLATRWRGGDNSWFDPNGEHVTPFDSSPQGHGTAVTGVMVGGAESGLSIGAAPEAKWVAVKIFNDDGIASFSAIHQGFQWLLDPDGDETTDDAPDVVNNSWGFDAAGGCVDEFVQDVEALRAAGISVVAAAGNFGPSQSSDVIPANYPQVMSVGSVDYYGNVDSTSSRGPSACNGEVFPSIVAPGVAILSADTTLKGVFPRSYSFLSGTSLAAPHVSGAIALIMSAFPALTPGEIEYSLLSWAEDRGESGPDDTYGHGLIDVMETYLNLTYSDSIEHYYNSILDRASLQAGAQYWFNRVKLLSGCIGRREVFGGLARYFFNSLEYLNKNKQDDEYISDLYEGLLRRQAGSEEIDYMSSLMAAGFSRNAILTKTIYSSEFKTLMDSRYGQWNSRPECDLVARFYRAFLARFPDSGGFTYWSGIIRKAQCTGSLDVLEACRRTARGFLNSREYLNRARSNREFVEGLYEGLMGRAPDLAGFAYWTGRLESGSLTRNQVLEGFLKSREFSSVTSRIAEAGCLQ